jgi:uncharacterized protein (TIGR02453 family)
MVKKKTATSHFTPELFRFLRALERNNNRDWFEKSKPRYLEFVRDPMLQFIEDFAPRLHTITPYLIADPSPAGGSMFRIYRDVRFSKDKSPYKTAATAQFRHERGRDVHTAGFYLHLGLDGVYVGTGIWHPDGKTLTKIRRAISGDPKSWQRITSSKTFRKHFRLGGESLVRAPKGHDPDHPLIEDLKRKDYVTMTQLSEKAACSGNFMDRFTEICRSSSPFMKFLTEAVGLEW